MPVESRRLQHLPLPPKLRQGLRRWMEGGIYGAIFDKRDRSGWRGVNRVLEVGGYDDRSRKFETNEVYRRTAA